MANKKKRNKHYRGTGAAIHTTVTKVSAVKRNPIHQWLYDRRQFRRPVLFGIPIVFIVIIMIIGLVDIIW